jgi:hypothetical protein
MGTLFQPFLQFLAWVLNRSLAEQLRYLKEENAILRARLPRRITVSPQERSQLLWFGADLSEQASFFVPFTALSPTSPLPSLLTPARAVAADMDADTLDDLVFIMGPLDRTQLLSLDGQTLAQLDSMFLVDPASQEYSDRWSKTVCTATH